MELVYLWVEKYKNIEKQGFNFSPRFECEYKDGTLTICDKKKKECKNNEYLENFFGKNINVTAIVGENGSGKSSLLNFIIEQNEHFGIFVFKNKDELLIFYKNIINKTFGIKCNSKYQLNPQFPLQHHTSLLFVKSYMDINTYTMNEQLTIPSRFFYFSEKRDFLSDLHKNTTELFNIISINSNKNIDDAFETNPYSILALNQHFSYLKDKYLHNILKYYPDLENFIGQYFKVDKVKYELKDLGTIFLASPSFKDNYKNDKFLSNLFNIFNQEKSTENRLKILCLIFCYLDEEKIKSFILEKQDNLSYIELYNLIKEKNDSYIIVWNNFIKVMNAKDDYKSIIKQYLIFIKEIRREVLEFSFTPSLSSGEEKLLYLFINIYDYVLYRKKVGTTKFIVIIDEPDTLLHPNWQKKLIFLLVTFINIFFKDDTFNFILSSHSPFLLSDIPKENVMFLEKDEKTGNCKNATSKTNIDTFGANIHTLLSHGFFMKDGLMGEFAKGKINEIKEFYDDVIKYKNNEEELIANRCVYDDKKDAFWSIQKIIGEPFLKTIMGNYLDELEQIFDNEVYKKNKKKKFLDQFSPEELQKYLDEKNAKA